MNIIRGFPCEAQQKSWTHFYCYPYKKGSSAWRPRFWSAGGCAARDQRQPLPSHAFVMHRYCAWSQDPAHRRLQGALSTSTDQPRQGWGHAGGAGGARKVTSCWIDSAELKAGLKLCRRWNKLHGHLLNRKAEDFQGIPNVVPTGQIHDGQMSFGLVPPVVPSKVPWSHRHTSRGSHKTGLVQPAPVKVCPSREPCTEGSVPRPGRPSRVL